MPNFPTTKPILDEKAWRCAAELIPKADAGLSQVLRRGRRWGDEVRNCGRYVAGHWIKFQTDRDHLASWEKMNACALILSDMLGMAPFFWARVLLEPMPDGQDFLLTFNLRDRRELPNSTALRG